MTAPPGPDPATPPGHAAKPDARATSETVLIAGAERWVREALDAWVEEDQAKVALAGPVAVELLGKATLWRENPVLLVPLNDRYEASLFMLATRPDLAIKGIKTIGLKIVINRLFKLLGNLPVTQDRQQRMVDVRNGAVHIGAGDESRHVLLDCLAVVGVLLERLGIERKDFLGPHVGTVDALLDKRKTEISRQVTVKMAKARARLTRLEDTLGEAALRKATGELEEQRWTLDPEDFVTDGGGVDVECPECGSRAKLFGEVDVDVEVDYDVERLGGGRYETIETPYLQAGLRPETFFCRVCNLQLHGTQELAEAELPSQYFDVTSEELGPDFDVDDHFRAIHGDY